MSEQLAIVLTMWGIFTGLGWVVWVVSTNLRKKRVAQTQAEMQAKLLDKLSASQDLAEFLKTEAGRRLMETTPAERTNPFGKILASIQIGLVLFLLGIALLSLAGVIRGAWDEMIVFGSISLAVGIGFMTSAGISYTLSKSWGLFDERRPGAD